MEKKIQEDLNKLISYYKSNNLILLEKESLRFTENYPDHYDGWNILGVCYRVQKKHNDALKIFKKLIKLYPSKIAAHTNLANVHADRGEVDNSIYHYKKALEINPNDINTLNSLGNALVLKGNLNSAKNLFIKSLEINDANNETHYNLGEIYRKQSNYKKAYKHYIRSNKRLSESHELECYYYLGDEEKIFEKLKKLSKTDNLTSLAACISAHAAISYSKEDGYPFCKNPMDFIFHKSLYGEENFNAKFKKSLIELTENKNLEFVTQSLLNKGKQSAGNLLLHEDSIIKELKKLIEKKITDYRNYYTQKLDDTNNKNDNFLENWPIDSSLYGWAISINDGGNLEPHIHKEAWLSGSIYISLPEVNDKNSGKLKVGMHGGNYPKKGKVFKSQVIPIVEGDIVMFPSSLFHETIPFKSSQNRVSFAFDLIPK